MNIWECMHHVYNYNATHNMKLLPINYFTDCSYSSSFDFLLYTLYRSQITTIHNSYVFGALICWLCYLAPLRHFLLFHPLGWPLSASAVILNLLWYYWYWAFSIFSFRYKFFVTVYYSHVSPVYTPQAHN